MNKNTVILNRILARQMSSLLQYVQHARPWSGPADEATLAELRQIIDEEQEACRCLAAAIQKRHATPATSKFHHGFSSSHFMSLEHFLPWLVSYQRWLIGQTEKDLGQIHDDEEALACGRQLLELSKKHLARLEELARSRAGQQKLSTVR